MEGNPEGVFYEGQQCSGARMIDPVFTMPEKQTNVTLIP